MHELSQNDEFLILASDGLWDVVTPFDAVKIIQKSFQEGHSPEVASEELCDLAIRLGSSDNVTVLIIRFLHHKS
jgi:serine/threonine protein phosphatase PrpC